MRGRCIHPAAHSMDCSFNSDHNMDMYLKMWIYGYVPKNVDVYQVIWNWVWNKADFVLVEEGFQSPPPSPPVERLALVGSWDLLLIYDSTTYVAGRMQAASTLNRL